MPNRKKGGVETAPSEHAADTSNTNAEDRTDSKQCEECDLHVPTDSENYCYDCKQYLCSHCQKAHQRGTTTKGHWLVRFEGFVTNPADKPVSTENEEPDTKASSLHPRRKLSSGEAVYVEQIDINIKTDKLRTLVSAIEIMEDGSLLVCDFSNQKIKLFDSDFEVISEISLASKPMGMVVLTPEDILVSLPDEKSLQKLKIKKGCILSLEQKVKTKQKCYRLVKYKDKLIAYAKDDLYRFFNIMDVDGNTVHCIMNEPRESGGVFTNVYYMSLSADNQSLYVADQEHGCVQLSLNGTVNFKYKEPGNKTIQGVCAGPNNCVYIACNESDKIVMIDGKGKKMKDLISVKGMKPTYLVYCEAKKTLLVKRGGPSKVLVYTINA